MYATIEKATFLVLRIMFPHSLLLIPEEGLLCLQLIGQPMQLLVTYQRNNQWHIWWYSKWQNTKTNIVATVKASVEYPMGNEWHILWYSKWHNTITNILGEAISSIKINDISNDKANGIANGAVRQLLSFVICKIQHWKMLNWRHNKYHIHWQ